jgi:hypothetical protein
MIRQTNRGALIHVKTVNELLTGGEMIHVKRWTRQSASNSFRRRFT